MGLRRQKEADRASQYIHTSTRAVLIRGQDMSIIASQHAAGHLICQFEGARTYFDPWTSERDNNLLWLC
jgi:hypothetical protein